MLKHDKRHKMLKNVEHFVRLNSFNVHTDVNSYSVFHKQFIICEFNKFAHDFFLKPNTVLFMYAQHCKQNV